MPLSNKEKTLIEDNLNNEYLCIRKYRQYAAMASDPKLRQTFADLASKEEQHANTLKGILSQNGISSQNIFDSYVQPQGDLSNVSQSIGITDAQMLNDTLATEKHVSSSYNTAVLESVDPNIRKQLQHIQKEEQDHAQTLFNEMNARRWYPIS